MDETIFEILTTVLVGTVGGLLAEYLQVPSGALIGSMLAVFILKILGGPVQELPPAITTKLQVLLMIPVGILIGASLERSFLANLRALWLPAVLFIGTMLATSLLVAFLMHWIAKIDLITAYLGTSPGGLNQIILIALSMRADTGVVIVLQTTRLIAVLLSVPWIVRWLR